MREELKTVVAMDSFKGSLSSGMAGDAVREGIERALGKSDTEVFEIADGGEGTVRAVSSRVKCRLVRCRVTGPLGEPVEAEYAITDEGTAVIEVAGACGLTLIPENKRDPMNTTTRGVGELIRDAGSRGCRNFLIGLGGSGTNDCGIGMLSELGYAFLDENGNPVPLTGAGLAEIARISDEKVLSFVKDCTFSIAGDVRNPLCGEHGASAVFGPQKGLKKKDIALMDGWCSRFAETVRGKYPDADPNLPGSGAVGGLGFAFSAFLSAESGSGAELILRITGFEEALADADLVITGEGRLDAQTAMGKAPAGVAGLARKWGKRVIAFAGCLGPGAEQCRQAGIAEYFAITEEDAKLSDALKPEVAYANLAKAVERYFRKRMMF